jgi:hypothetical protein
MKGKDLVALGEIFTADVALSRALQTALCWQ